ncbi:MAG: gliding motility-associated C-terminal domain-containing protein, partial [Flavobacteriales bacterium]
MKISTLAILGLAFSGPLLAQTTSTSDCNGAIQLCGGTYTETTAPTGTGNVYEFTGTCNQNLESASIWYTFTVQSPGNLSFILSPASTTDDYDWGMFNITNGGCAGINAQDGTSPEVECNSYGLIGTNGATGISTANGGTGTSNGGGNLNGPPFNADLGVVVGQTYALVVMNWTGSTSGYSIDFSQSTASIYDENPPSISAVIPDCFTDTLHVHFSEPIVTNTVSATDFTLTAPSGTVLPCVAVLPNDPSLAGQSDYSIVLGSIPTEGGTYTLTITSASGNVDDLCGNIVVDTTFQVHINAPLDYNLGINTACNGTGGSFQVNYVNGGNPPVTFYLQGSGIPTGTPIMRAPGNYGLTVIDSVGCESTATVTIPDHDIEVEVPQLQDSLSCSHSSITIQGVQVIPDQTVEYLWIALTEAGSDSTFSDSISPVVDQPGFYTVWATDTISGCMAMDTVTIIATGNSLVDLSTVQLPNVVSPNGDGHNDVWRPFLPANPGLDVTELFETYSLTIFDRWGKTVFESVNGGKRSWNPKDADDGTYFYKIKYTAECGAIIDKDL